MDQYHKPHGKKVGKGSGGRKRKSRDKKLCHMGGSFASTKAADKVSKSRIRSRGGNERIKLKKTDVVNVVGKGGKVKKAKIIRVIESHNLEYVRMNIITRGAVLETDIGKVMVTNRVGQDGIVNGVLI